MHSNGWPRFQAAVGRGLVTGGIVRTVLVVGLVAAQLIPAAADINVAGTRSSVAAQSAARSIEFNGVSSFVEAPHAPDLNLLSDWTVEAWFKDDDPGGFDHNFRQILMKGDRDAESEAPYYVVIGFNHLLAGVRTEYMDYPIHADLADLGLDPSQWHHVAVTFRADVGLLDLWLDGQHIRDQLVADRSLSGNSLPLQIGRNGPAMDKYWQGKLAHVRLWSLARPGTAIQAQYRTRLPGGAPGLVANWPFEGRSRFPGRTTSPCQTWR